MQEKSHVELYKSIGNKYPNLFQAADVVPRPPAKIIGRDSEEIRRGLRNPEKANIVLLGEPGSGKTAAVQDFAYSDGSEESYLTLEVNPEKVIGASEDRDSALLRGFRSIVDEAGEYSRDNNVIVVLFIDEFHKLAMFSPSLIEALKPILEKSALNNFRIIASTTFEEYNEWIASKNRALDQRFLRITLNELPKKVIIKILQGRAEQHGVEELLAPDILESIYHESKRILISNSQPRASIDILLSMIGETIKDEWMEDGVLKRTFQTPEELGIASEYSISRPLLKKIIKRTHSIDIDNKVNTKQIKNDLVAKLYDQDQAIDTVMGYLEIAAVGFSDPERPKFSFLSTGSTGVGKALADNMLVPVYGKDELYKKHGDLKVGDFVFDRLGQPTKVIGVYPQGMRDQYEITFEDGSVVKCDKEHLWTFRKANESIWQTETLEELLGLDYSLYEVPIGQGVLRDGYELSKEESPYFDGLELVINDNISKTIPNRYKKGSFHQRWKFIQGLFDYGGRITSNGEGKVSFTHSSKKLVKDIKEVLASLGITSQLKKTKEGHCLDLWVDDRKKVLLFTRGTKHALAKHNLAKYADGSNEKVKDGLRIQRIKKTRKQVEMSCIMVDNEEHLYQVGKGHIVTHNTELAKIVTESMRVPLKRFDMSRYAAEEDAGIFADDLFQAAWSAPNSYILVDEVEKSSRQAMNILLQVLDDARLNDSENPDRVASFSGNIINLTTNLGSEVYQSMQRHGSKIDTELIYKALSDSEVFETAVLGRIDAIVPFVPLPFKALEKIARQTLRDVIDIGETKDRRIIVSEDIIPYIVKDRTSMDSERGGARDVKRNIKDLVARGLAHQIANETEELPIIIHLYDKPRFKYKDIVDPLNAKVKIQECYSIEATNQLLKNIGGKMNRPLVSEGLYLPNDIPMKEHAGKIIKVVRKGYYKLTTNVSDDVIAVKGVD